MAAPILMMKRIIIVKKIRLITSLFFAIAISFFIYYNKMGYKKDEPGDYCGTESSGRFEQLISTAVIDGEISMSKGASLWGHSLSELRRLVATLI